MINWKQKLTSRKFWAAIASFVALLIVATGGTQNQAAQITAIIMAGATVAAYIVGEGLVDSASAGATTINNNFSDGAKVEGISTPTGTQGAQSDGTGAADAVQAAQEAISGTGDKVTAETDKVAETAAQA